VRLVEHGVAPEDRRGEATGKTTLEGRLVESGACDDGASIIVVWGCVDDALQSFIRERHTTCVKVAGFAAVRGTQPLECRIQVLHVSVRPAPTAGREPDADTPVFLAGHPANSAVICHVPAPLVPAGVGRTLPCRQRLRSG
jgi:hypothetical protein